MKSKSKRTGVILSLILLIILLSVPVAAELDYSVDTPTQNPVTVDELPTDSTTDFGDVLGSEEIEIEDNTVPLVVVDFDDDEPIKDSPQTGDMITPILLFAISAIGAGAVMFFAMGKKKTNKV